MTFGIHHLVRGALAAGLVLALGCGDDSGHPSDAAVDSAADSSTPADSGRDTSVADTGGADTGSADTGGGDAGAPSCDPYAADSCPDGQKCSVVLAFGPAPDNALESIRFGCVDGARAKGELAPCSISRDATPENADDNTVADDCQQGLFCFTAEATPGVRVCRPLCDGMTTDCGTDHFCLGLNNDPFFGVCQTAENCDPVFQTGCAPGEACYVLGGTNGDLLGTCFTPSTPDGGTGAPGEACRFLDSCQAGSGCFPELLPDGGLGDALCRPFCDATSMDGGVADSGAADSGAADGGAADSGAADGGDAGVADGGAADSGSPFTGRCTAPASCLALDPGDAGVRVPTTPGRCQ